MSLLMKRLTVVLAVLTVVLAMAYKLNHSAILLSLCITAATTLYHFAMRLIVGAAFDMVMNNRADYTKRWYQVGPGDVSGGTGT